MEALIRSVRHPLEAPSRHAEQQIIIAHNGPQTACALPRSRSLHWLRLLRLLKRFYGLGPESYILPENSRIASASTGNAMPTPVFPRTVST